MEDKTGLENAANTVLNEPLKIEVDISPRNKIHAFLQKIKIRPVKRIFYMKHIYLGTLLRISKVLLRIDMEAVKDKLGMEVVHTLVTNDLATMAEVIALALHNKKTKVPKKLIDFVIYNFTAIELYKTVLLIIGQMNVKDFINSIILIRGANILTNPNVSVKDASASEVSL